MKTTIEFEMLDTSTIRWNIKIDMDARWFIDIASQVYRQMTGQPLYTLIEAKVSDEIEHS